MDGRRTAVVVALLAGVLGWLGAGAPAALAAAPAAGGYSWPVRPGAGAAGLVEVPFREPTHRYGPGHRGVDLAATPEAPVLAAGAGTVVFAGPLAGRGVVSVQHADGLRTTYEPVVPAVAVGTPVEAGEVLGTVAAGHRGCRATCLHWGVRRAPGDYLDPLLLLMPPHVRLLPVPDPWPGTVMASRSGGPGAEPGEQPAGRPADTRPRRDAGAVGHLAAGRGPPQAHRGPLACGPARLRSAAPVLARNSATAAPRTRGTAQLSKRVQRPGSPRSWAASSPETPDRTRSAGSTWSGTRSAVRWVTIRSSGRRCGG